MLATTQKKLDILEGAAAVIGRASATSVWFEDHGNLYLRVVAGDKTWSVCARPEPRDDAEAMCVGHLLRKLTLAAHLCPKCLAAVPRAGCDENNRPRTRAYRCDECLHSWTDS